MSLTDKDLQQIRVIVREESDSIITSRLKPIEKKLSAIEGRLEALENDVKEIYSMLRDANIPPLQDNDEDFDNRLLEINSELLQMAKQRGLKLPNRA